MTEQNREAEPVEQHSDAGKTRTDQDELMAEHIRSLADMSYRTELNRDDTIKQYAEYLLVCMTILAAAYLTPAQVLWELFGVGSEASGWHCCVCFAYCLLLVPLLVAIVITLLGCGLRGSTVLASPLAQFDYFSKVMEQGVREGRSLSQMEIARSYCDALEAEYKALEKKHKIMWACLRLGTILSVVSCCIAIVCISLLVPAVL